MPAWSSDHSGSVSTRGTGSRAKIPSSAAPKLTPRPRSRRFTSAATSAGSRSASSTSAYCGRGRPSAS